MLISHDTAAVSNSIVVAPHAWTPDGAVIYETPLHGRTAIFKQKITDTTSHLLAELPRAAAMPQISPDGKWVLFMEFVTHAHPDAIYRVSVTGGQPELVPASGPIEEFHCPSAPNTPCVLREALDHDAFAYYALDPIKGMGKLLTRTAWEPSLLGDWSVSPAGSTVAAAGHDALHPSIHLIKLNGASADSKNLPVNGYGTTQGVNWTQDGHALFVETRGEDGYDLIYLELTGHERALYKSPLHMGRPIARWKEYCVPGLHHEHERMGSKHQSISECSHIVPATKTQTLCRL